MAAHRPAQRVRAVERRPAVPVRARASASVAARSPAQALQSRLGNQATQVLIARSLASPKPATAENAASVKVAAPLSVQASRGTRLPLPISKPTDAAELEAEHTARKVARMSTPSANASKATTSNSGKGSLQRAATAQPALPASAAPVARVGAGSPLPANVRTQMEPRFGANFGQVRVHTNEAAAAQSAALQANAFTLGQHIYFGRDKFQPQSAAGQELIAHELTHTIQQGAAVQRDIQRSALPTVSEVSPQIQRDWLPDSLNPRRIAANKAAAIPGFTMLTVVLGFNPITNDHVERNAGNILRGAIELIPGGSVVTEALNNHGIFDQVSQWASRQFDALKGIGSSIVHGIEDLLSNPSADLGAMWERGKAIVMGPVDRIIAFAKGLKDGIVTLVKDAILKPIAAWAQKTSGYPLLCMVMGKDPITGEPVNADAEALVGGFMKFIGEEEVWEKMQKANAIPRAFAWFKNALNSLRGFVAEIPGLFVQAFKSLELADIILVPRAFLKLAGVFGGFAVRFVSWGAGAVWSLLEIIFDVVSPGALGYVKKTGGALKGILKNPLPFVGNLVKAAKLGFLNFGDHFLDHLKAGLIDWLTGSLPGIYIPKAFSLGEIAKFAFSVLGLTWANIRQKLVKATSETVVKALETGFDVVVTLVRDGPAAAWDKIKEQLANLKDMVIDGITDFIVDMVVKKAIPKLIAMFIPGAGFISAILSIYDTVMVFVNKISKIIQVVTGFIDSIVAIAGGQIGAAASRVETTLAGLLSLAINFLAGFAGLGKVADKLMGVFNKIRAPIDKALDWLVGWIVTAAKKLGKMVAQAGVPQDPVKRFQEGMALAKKTVNRFAGKKVGRLVLAPLLAAIKVRYGFKVLELFQSGPKWWLAGDLNPKETQQTDALAAADGEPTTDKKLKVDRSTDNLAGDTVGVSMTVDWLDSKGTSGGGPPRDGAQAKLMNLLVTDPSKGSPFKFIRGHLLNEHLGGAGTAENLFPITGNANSQHLHSTEKTVKSWMTKKDRWVFYQVKVTNVSKRLNAGPKSPMNYVNCTFVCQAILKDESGKAEETFATTIPSTYEVKEEAERIDGPKGKTRG